MGFGRHFTLSHKIILKKEEYYAKPERNITDFERYAIRKNAYFFGVFREIFKSRTIL